MSNKKPLDILGNEINTLQQQLDDARADTVTVTGELTQAREALRYMRGALANVAAELEDEHESIANTLDTILDGSYRLGGDLPGAELTCKS